MSSQRQKIRALSRILTHGEESLDSAIIRYSSQWGCPPQEVHQLLQQIIDQAHSPLASPTFQSMLPVLHEATSVTEKLLLERNSKKIEHRLRLMEGYQEASGMVDRILESMATPKPTEFSSFYALDDEDQDILLARDHRLHCRDPKELVKWQNLKLSIASVLAKLDGYLGARGDMVFSQTQHSNGSLERSVAFRGIETSSQVERALQLLGKNGKAAN